MAVVSALIEDRVRHAAELLSAYATVKAAYLFGSQANGTPHEHSDIDIGVFVEKKEKWNILKRAEISAAVQREAGDDLELHFFPAESLINPDPASFAAYVINNGVRINLSLKK